MRSSVSVSVQHEFMRRDGVVRMAEANGVEQWC
jgi:hypothetical protein